MNEPQRARLPLIALVVAVAALVLMIVLVWPENAPLGPGRDLLGPPDPMLENDLGPPLRAQRNVAPPPALGEGSTLQARDDRETILPDGRGGLDWRPPEKPDDDFLDDRSGRLIVQLGGQPAKGGGDEEDASFLLVLTPLTGLDPWTRSRVVALEKGTNTIDDLPCVDWQCQLVGDRKPKVVEIRNGQDMFIAWQDADLHFFRPLRIAARDREDREVADLLLLHRNQQGRRRLPPIPVGYVEAEGHPEFRYRIGPYWKSLVLAAPGWLPESVERDPETEGGREIIPSSEHRLRALFDRPSARLRVRFLGESGGIALPSSAIFVAGENAAEVVSRAHGRRSDQQISIGRHDGDGMVIDLPPGTSGRLFVAARGLRPEGPILIETGPAGSESKREILVVEGRTIRGSAAPAMARDYRNWPFRGACYGPIDDGFCRVRPTRLGSYLIESAPRDRFGLGRFESPDATTATMVWPVEIGQAGIVLTR